MEKSTLLHCQPDIWGFHGWSLRYGNVLARDTSHERRVDRRWEAARREWGSGLDSLCFP